MSDMATILVVDDDPIVRDVVVRYLERDGHRTLVAGDGNHADELLRREALDLVVLDVMLPGRDGLALSRSIRSRSSLPIILLTARGEEADRIVGLELGADDYVTKPFSPRELAARVRALLRRASTQPDQRGALSFGDVVLDGDAREVPAGRWRGRADGAGVRSPLVPRLASATGLLARPAHDERLGLRARARDRHRDRPRQASAEEDRGGPRAAAAPPDGLGCRLQARAVIQSGLVVALATLAVGLAIAFALRALPTLRLRLVGLAVLAVCLPLIVVLASGWVMFEMGDDVKILAVSAASASVALVAALVIAGSIERPIERLARAAAELAGGDLAARAPEDGPAEVASLARDFNEMGNALARIFDARRELVAWASHDLRTPLANMQAMLEALEDGLAEPADYLPALRDQVRVLSQLVDDLFELGRIEAGALALELRELPITPVVERCLVGLGAEAAIRGVRLETVGPADATARFAPDKIERVLLNLLTNALRHTPTDGCVAVVVKPGHDEVHVRVEDTGDGIDAESVERMFERFWRGDQARSTPGAGLGLAIARGLVEAHGGRIWAERRTGGGTSVSFTLPA